MADFDVDINGTDVRVNIASNDQVVDVNSNDYRVTIARSGAQGSRGSDGVQGPQGNYYVKLFLRSATEPATPTDVTWTPGTGGGSISGANAAGWSLSIPAGTGDLWEIETLFDPNNDSNITSWSAVFQAGDQGPPGDRGEQGPTGSTGIQGPTGLRGDQGAQGPTGSTGFTGATGEQGLTGPRGDQGAQGVQGPTGSTGNQGAQGVTGNTGSQGIQGEQGIQGTIGPTGPRGDQGAQGPTGQTGHTGIQGNVGPQGTIGVTGSTGSTGPTGVQGQTGAAGAAFTEEQEYTVSSAQNNTLAINTGFNIGADPAVFLNGALLDTNDYSVSGQVITFTSGNAVYQGDELVFVSSLGSDSAVSFNQAFGLTEANATANQGIRRNSSDTAWEFYTPYTVSAGDITTNLIADNAVTTAKIANASVTTSKVAENAIGPSQLNLTGNGAAGQYLISDGDGTMSWHTFSPAATYTGLSGVVNATNTGVVSFTSSAVDDSTLELDSSGTIQIKDLGVTTGKLPNSVISTVKIADDAVTSAKIADNSVGASALNVTGNGTSGQYLSSDGDGTMSWATLGHGGHTISSNGTDLTQRGTLNFSTDFSVTDDSTNSETDVSIANNVIGANELNVSGNGTSGQILTSDGDGTMSWTTPVGSAQFTRTTSGLVPKSGSDYAIRTSGGETIHIASLSPTEISGRQWADITSVTITGSGLTAAQKTAATTLATIDFWVADTSNTNFAVFRSTTMTRNAITGNLVTGTLTLLGSEGDAARVISGGRLGLNTAGLVATVYDVFTKTLKADGSWSSIGANAIQQSSINAQHIDAGGKANGYVLTYDTSQSSNQIWRAPALQAVGNYPVITGNTSDAANSIAVDGMIYYNGTSDEFRVRVNGAWEALALQGGAGASGGVTFQTLESTIVNSGNYNTTTRVLTIPGIADAGDVFAVYQEGLRLAPSSYTAGTNSITFGSGLTINNGDHIFVDLLS